MKLLIMQFSPNYYFIPPGANILSQHHSQTPSVHVFPLMCQAINFHGHTKPCKITILYILSSADEKIQGCELHGSKRYLNLINF
jgi:hypothetical protein